MAVEWINNMYNKGPGKFSSSNSAVLLGLIKNEYVFTQIEDLKTCTENG